MSKDELRKLCTEAAASHTITKVPAKRTMSQIRREAFMKRTEAFLISRSEG